MNAASRTAFDLARTLPLKPGAWTLMTVEAPKHESAISDLMAELKAAGEPCRRIAVGADQHGWIASLQDPSTDIAVLEGFADWSSQDWEEADYLRARLSRAGAQVWVLPSRSASDMMSHAPNIASYVGGNTFGVCPDAAYMDEAEVAERLKALEGHYGFSAQGLIAKAEKNELAWEPEFAEWLVLLGRGDLIP